MGIWLEEEIVQKTVEKILFRVAGVTKYKKAVKEACNLIAEDNGIPEYAKYYSNLSTKELREELEEYGMKVFKYQDLDFFNIELVPEVDNKYDPNAIKVLIFNNHVGYVPATVAKTIRKYFDNKKYNFVIEGEIKGGPYKEWDDLNDKVITNNDLDIGFEIYLSVIDSTLEESNEVSPTTPIENVVHKKTEKESSELALDVHEIDLREKEEQRNIEPVLTSDALELKKESDLVQLSKPTIPIEGNALNVLILLNLLLQLKQHPKKKVLQLNPLYYLLSVYSSYLLPYLYCLKEKLGHSLLG